MGWRRVQYEKRQKISRSPYTVDNFSRKKFHFREETKSKILEKTIFLERYAFPLHVIERYRERVKDPFISVRSDRDIVRILAHSLDESFIPEKIPFREEYNLFVNIHDPDFENLNVKFLRSFGVYHIPIRKDIFDEENKRIVPMTIKFPARYLILNESYSRDIYKGK